MPRAAARPRPPHRTSRCSLPPARPRVPGRPALDHDTAATIALQPSVAAHCFATMRRSLGLAIALLVGACGAGTTPLGTPDPASATTTQGRFALAFTIERSTVHATDVIAGAARLTLLTPGAATVTGSSDMITFEFAEVGG